MSRKSSALVLGGDPPAPRRRIMLFNNSITDYGLLSFFDTNSSNSIGIVNDSRGAIFTKQDYWLSETGSFGTDIRILTIWLDGTNLKIDFRNTAAPNSRTIAVELGIWEVSN